jgi:hypothetical protein
MTNGDPIPIDELTDSKLDALLESADLELLDQVHVVTDPNAALTRVMARCEPNVLRTLQPSPPQAVTMIVRRSVARRIVRDLIDLATTDLEHDLATARTRACGSVRDYSFCCVQELGVHLTGASSLADKVDRSLAHSAYEAFTLARDLTEADVVYEHACELVRALKPISDFAHDLANDLACSRIRALDLDRSKTLDRVITLADALELARERVVVLAGALDLARNLAHVLANVVAAGMIEASGMDLSYLKIDDPSVLNGTIWTDETTWPSDIVDLVRSCSRRMRPGVYQFGRWDERSHSRLIPA